MKRLLILIIVCTSVTVCHAQKNYDHAIGIKAGGGISFTYKQFITGKNNIEAMATLWNEGFRASGLYEFNFFTFNTVEGLNLFAGPGVHLGFWKNPDEKNGNSQVEFGIDGIIGLDYTFKTVPINLSLDWQPSVTLAGNAGFTPSFGGFAVRYTF